MDDAWSINQKLNYILRAADTGRPIFDPMVLRDVEDAWALHFVLIVWYLLAPNSGAYSATVLWSCWEFHSGPYLHAQHVPWVIWH